MEQYQGAMTEARKGKAQRIDQKRLVAHQKFEDRPSRPAASCGFDAHEDPVRSARPHERERAPAQFQEPGAAAPTRLTDPYTARKQLVQVFEESSLVDVEWSAGA